MVGTVQAVKDWVPTSFANTLGIHQTPKTLMQKGLENVKSFTDKLPTFEGIKGAVTSPSNIADVALVGGTGVMAYKAVKNYKESAEGSQDRNVAIMQGAIAAALSTALVIKHTYAPYIAPALSHLPLVGRVFAAAA